MNYNQRIKFNLLNRCLKNYLLFLIIALSPIISFSQNKSVDSEKVFLSKFQGTWVSDIGEVWYKVVISGTKFKLETSRPEHGRWGGLFTEEGIIESYGNTFSKVNGQKLPFLNVSGDRNYLILYTGVDFVSKKKEIALQSNYIKGNKRLIKVPSNYNAWN